ncbi:MAG: hypothetical protein ABFS35_21325 [Bacteroidota bacterium]
MYSVKKEREKEIEKRKDKLAKLSFLIVMLIIVDVILAHVWDPAYNEIVGAFSATVLGFYILTSYFIYRWVNKFKKIRKSQTSGFTKKEKEEIIIIDRALPGIIIGLGIGLVAFFSSGFDLFSRGLNGIIFSIKIYDFNDARLTSFFVSSFLVLIGVVSTIIAIRVFKNSSSATKILNMYG